MKKLSIALAISTIITCAVLFQQHVPVIISWIHSLGLLAPMFFLLLYCIATLFFLPTMVLTLAGGALFGPLLGTLLNLLGATLGAVCSFWVSRHLVFDWVASQNNARINALITGVERQGWQFVALLRLVPIIPFNIVNYGLGVTRIKFSHYLLATVIFLIPTEILFTYCGFRGMDILIHPQALYKNTGLLVLIGLLGVVLFKSLRKRQQRALSSN